MVVATMARGQQETLDALRAFTKECEAFIREHKSTFKGEGRHRVMFEGIATWPYLRATYSPLAHSGVNVTSCVYGPSFTFSYDNFDGMIEKYCSVPNSTNLERSTDLREQLCLEGKVDGGLVHINRSCKMWSSFAPEMARRISRAGNDSVLHDAAKGHVSHVVRLAQESAAVGVVLLLAKFCDPEEFDAPPCSQRPAERQACRWCRSRWTSPPRSTNRRAPSSRPSQTSSANRKTPESAADGRHQ